MSEPRHNPFLLGDRTYDFMKKLVQVVLPAFGTLYFALAEIWNLPAADKVTGTILCVTTFLGVCLGISTAQYHASGKAYDGNITLIPQAEGPTRIDIQTKTADPLAIFDKKAATFKVETVMPLVEAEVNSRGLEVEAEVPDKSSPKARRKRSGVQDTNPL